ncbi:MAG: hypothetical protein ACYTEU_11020 [Planctomycetota bacterium]|jgi:hypothetical protein
MPSPDLAQLIERFEESVYNQAYAGAIAPEEAPFVEMEYKLARHYLETAISNMEEYIEILEFTKSI